MIVSRGAPAAPRPGIQYSWTHEGHTGNSDPYAIYSEKGKPVPPSFWLLYGLTLLCGCESWKLTEKVRRKLNGTCCKMLSKIPGRNIYDEARTPAVDVLIRARYLRWSRLRHFLRMGERRLVRQMLLDCVNPTPESVSGDIIDQGVNAAISIANNRIYREEKEQALEAMLIPFGD